MVFRSLPLTLILAVGVGDLLLCPAASLSLPFLGWELPDQKNQLWAAGKSFNLASFLPLQGVLSLHTSCLLPFPVSTFPIHFSIHFAVAPLSTLPSLRAVS